MIIVRRHRRWPLTIGIAGSATPFHLPFPAHVPSPRSIPSPTPLVPIPHPAGNTPSCRLPPAKPCHHRTGRRIGRTSPYTEGSEGTASRRGDGPGARDAMDAALPMCDAVLATAPRTVGLGRVQPATPGPDEVVIRTVWTSISAGTERQMLSGAIAPPGGGALFPLHPRLRSYRARGGRRRRGAARADRPARLRRRLDAL